MKIKKRTQHDTPQLRPWTPHREEAWGGGGGLDLVLAPGSISWSKRPRDLHSVRVAACDWPTVPLPPAHLFRSEFKYKNIETVRLLLDLVRASEQVAAANHRRPAGIQSWTQILVRLTELNIPAHFSRCIRLWPMKPPRLMKTFVTLCFLFVWTVNCLFNSDDDKVSQHWFKLGCNKSNTDSDSLSESVGAGRFYADDFTLWATRGKVCLLLSW